MTKMRVWRGDMYSGAARCFQPSKHNVGKPSAMKRFHHIHSIMSSDQITPRSRFSTRPRLVAISLCFFLSFGAQILLAADVPSEVVDAATNGLQLLLAHIPPGEKALYGFSDNDDLAQAGLGRPLLMHTINPTSLSSTQSAGAVSSLISETTMWFFPVTLGTEAKAMLVIDREAGAWKAVSLGYASLAYELNHIWEQWPESKRFHPKLIAVFQAKRFYFTVPEVDDFNLTPIASPQRTLETSNVPTQAPKDTSVGYSTLDSLSNAVQNLRSAVRNAGVEPMP